MRGRNHPIRAASVTTAVLALALARGCACTGPTEEPPQDGGTASTATTTSSSATTSTITTTSGTGGEGGAVPSGPCPGWPGWEAWDDFAPQCPLCVPMSKDVLPPPIEWEPCAPEAKMPVGCRQMKADWPWYNTPFAYAASVDVGEDGKAVMEIARLSNVGENQWRVQMVADADGPVHSAFLDPRGEGIKGCTNWLSHIVGMSGGKHILSVIDGDLNSEYNEAAVGGSIDELHPKPLKAWMPSYGLDLSASDAVWVSSDGSNVGIAPWGQPWQTVYTSADSGGLQQVGVRAFHDFVTWTSGDGAYMGTMAWTPEKGAYPLLTYPGDWTRGVQMLGTDGKHLVWAYGEGRSQPLGDYDKVSVMAAPFTTDPAQLQPKRLRSLPVSWLASPWIVGCGYAANEYDADKVLIVRLSDGVSWELTYPDPSAPPLQRWHFSTVFALSCDEIFLQGSVGLAMNVVRLRLDALGPGMPPD